MSEYGDMCRDLRDAKREARRKFGQPCPVCVEKLPKANPSILLPGQRCKIHGYRDPRQRTRENEYLNLSSPTIDASTDRNQAKVVRCGKGIE